jgi:hypothetical protein
VSMTGKIEHVEVMTSVQRRRRWSAEEKAAIAVTSSSIEGRPRRTRALVKARCSASEELNRHRPFGLKMAALADFSGTLKRRSSR